MSARAGARVLGAFIDALSFEAAAERILGWARGRESRYVCICNAHVVVTATRDRAYAAALDGADMATPDGEPVAWVLRRRGFPGQARIAGADLTELLCARAADAGVPVYFHGSTEQTLARLRVRLAERFPALSIAGTDSPPFRPLSDEEDRASVERINASGAGIVFVGLGCPKQEQWMAAHRGRVRAVMIGIGAAFDFMAETSARAPLWMQRRGLEWVHRLASEPGRLWKRYLVTNTLFVVGMAREMFVRRR